MAMTFDPKRADSLSERMRRGDAQAVAQLFTEERARLRRMVRLRLDRRLQGRIDPSDVLQEAFLEASKRLEEYRAQPNIPARLWLRLLTGQRLLILHRHHLGAQMRAVGQEVSLFQGAFPAVTSASLVAQLLGRHSSPSQAAMRAEMQIKLQEALNGMEPLDREVLALRHFEELSNNETALVLGLSKSAASNRYVRALTRLKAALEQATGDLRS
jgi:RNA polymerase sigma-70 factor (ECF subfamily)